MKNAGLSTSACLAQPRDSSQAARLEQLRVFYRRLEDLNRAYGTVAGQVLAFPALRDQTLDKFRSSVLRACEDLLRESSQEVELDSSALWGKVGRALRDTT